MKYLTSPWLSVLAEYKYRQFYNRPVPNAVSYSVINQLRVLGMKKDGDVKLPDFIEKVDD